MIAERFQAWRDGVDAAIADMREREGFDGTTREWRTLGDVVGMRSAPAPKPAKMLKPPQAPRKPRMVCGRRWVHCSRCHTPRWVGERCPSCAAGLDEVRRAS